MSNKLWKLAVLPIALVFVLGIVLAMHTTSMQALQPEAVTIAKDVESHTCSSMGTATFPMCMAGDILTFTIVIRTDITDTVTMTDPLPMYTDPVYYDDEGQIVSPGNGTIGSGTVSAGEYTWTGEMPAGSAVTLTLSIQVSEGAPAGTSLQNTAYAMGESDSAAEDLVVWAPLFLPSAMKEYTAP